MATISIELSGGSTPGDHVLETFEDALQEIAHALLRMQQITHQQLQENQRHQERRFQEALQEQEQRLHEYFRQQIQEIERQNERRMQEALQDQELRLQATYRQQLQEVLCHQQRTQEKVHKLLGKKISGAADLHSSFGGTGGMRQQDVLETRMCKLEASLERALQDLFPRVDALLTHLERPSSPNTPSAQTATSPTSDSASTSGGVSACPPASALSPLSSTSSPTRSPPCAAIPSAAAPALQGASTRAMEEAVKHGRTEEVRRLLDAGADVNAPVKGGWTLLMLAAKLAHHSVVSLLLEREADVHATSWDAMTALHFAAHNDRTGRCVSLLARAGADVGARARTGRTPLHEAAGRDNERAVRALLDAGASRTAREHQNRAPLDLATTPTIRRLLQF